MLQKKTHLKNMDTLESVVSKSINKIIKHLETNFTTKQIFQLNKTLSKYLDFMDRDKDRKKLLEYALKVKEKMSESQQERTCAIKTRIEDGTLKTVDELKTALDKLYDDREYKKYIINYLLINFHTRNQDLDLIITKTKRNMDDNKNYLLVRKSKIEFIRNNYKTKDLYGTKEYTITDKKFIDAVTQLGEIKLLHTNNVSREVSNNTIDKLTESEMNKIMM